jgi:phospholipid transport system substrate-binding protein
MPQCRARWSPILALAVLLPCAGPARAQSSDPAIPRSLTTPKPVPLSKSAAAKARHAAPSQPAATLKPVSAHRAVPAPNPAAELTPILDPQEAVATLINRVAATVHDPNLSPLRRRERLHALIARNFDMPAMAQAVLGRHWAAASEAERAQFVAVVDDYMVVTYAPRLAEYGKVAFTVHGQFVERGAPGAPDTLLIRTTSDQPDAAPPIPINWLTVDHGDRYKITDVIIAGVSLVEMKRAEINSAVYWSDGALTKLLDTAAVLVSCAKE